MKSISSSFSRFFTMFCSAPNFVRKLERSAQFHDSNAHLHNRHHNIHTPHEQMVRIVTYGGHRVAAGVGELGVLA